jgi:hypothetical protein
VIRLGSGAGCGAKNTMSSLYLQLTSAGMLASQS